MGLLPTALARNSPGYFGDHVQAWGKLNDYGPNVVRDFNADPTGQNDASAEFNAALTEADGGTVFVPPGDYAFFDDSIRPKVPGFRLVGDGRRSRLFLPPGANRYLIKFDPAPGVRMDECEVSNLQLDCDGANQTSGGGIDAYGASYCDFDRLRVYRPRDYGLYWHSDNIGGWGHHNTVTRSWFRLGVVASAAGGIGTAIRMSDSDENTVGTGCRFEANGGGLNNAAQIFDTAGLQHIHGAIFVADPNVASVEHFKTTGHGGSVIGCTFDGGTNAQVELSGDEWTVTGNRFYMPISNSDCLMINGQRNAVGTNSFASASAEKGTSRSAINATGASGQNWRSAVQSLTTNTAWSSGAYIGNTNQLAIPTS